MKKGSPEFLKSSFARDYVELTRRNAEQNIEALSLPSPNISSNALPNASPTSPDALRNTTSPDSLPSVTSPPTNSSGTAIDIQKRSNYYVRDCAISTSSAPSYLAPYKLRTVKQIAELSQDYVIALDGGIGVNHPYLCGITEAVSLYPNAEAFFIMSFGTGECETVSVKNPPCSILGLATELPDMFMGSESKMAFHILKTLGTLYNRKIYFLRIQMKLPQEHMIMEMRLRSMWSI
jgi:hypothetical protein